MSDKQAWAERVRPNEAATVLTDSYAERAGEEALFRAFLAERDLQTEQAAFWVKVYEKVSALKK